MMVRLGCKELDIPIRALWRSTVMDNGELFAMMVLVHLMPTLFAGNRDTLELKHMILSPC